MNDEYESHDTTPDEHDEALRPLGYWLRLVDGLLSREFATAFEGEGITRRDWMLLNALSGDVEAPGLTERLARTGGKRLRRLEDLGWAEEQGDGTWALTEAGREAKERLGETVGGVRARVSGAVSSEDYATTVASLEAIARELGWDESQPFPRGRGFGPGRFGGGFGGFGGRFGGPGRFGPDFRFGWGPGPRRGEGDGPAWGEHRWQHAHPRGWHQVPPAHEHGHHSYEHGHHSHDHGHHAHDHGHHSHEHGHRGHGRRKAERAYERGFAAGFAAARKGPDADPGRADDAA